MSFFFSKQDYIELVLIFHEADSSRIGTSGGLQPPLFSSIRRFFLIQLMQRGNICGLHALLRFLARGVKISRFVG